MITKNGLFHSSVATLLVVSIASFTPGFAQAAASDKQKLNLVKLYWADRSIKERAERVSNISDLMNLKNPGIERIHEKLKETGGLNGWIPLAEENPDVMLKVSPEYDEIRIINAKLAVDASGDDIGERAALEVAIDYLAKFEKNDLLNGGWRYDARHYQIGQHLIGEGSLDGKIKKSVVTEYRVTFRASVDGVQLANAGVRIAVHRSGKISGIRIGGVSGRVACKNNQVQVVSDKQINEAFRRNVPERLKPRIAWQRVMYVMPEDEKSAIVEPLHVVSYSLVSVSDKQEVVSRRKTIGISITDLNAPVIDFSKPAREHRTTKVSRNPVEDKERHQKIVDHERQTH